MKRLMMRLTEPGCAGFYWHCRKRKKLPIIDLPKSEFRRACWPGKGFTFAQACSISAAAGAMRGSGTADIDCGTFLLTAYWAADEDASGGQPREDLTAPRQVPPITCDYMSPTYGCCQLPVGHEGCHAFDGHKLSNP